MDKRSIIVSKEVYDKLTLIAAKYDKFLYQLVDEATELLEEKYRNITLETNNE